MCVYICVYMSIYICVCIYIYIHECVQIYIYIYIYIYVYVICIHAHAYMNNARRFPEMRGRAHQLLGEVCLERPDGARMEHIEMAISHSWQVCMLNVYVCM